MCGNKRSRPSQLNCYHLNRLHEHKDFSGFVSNEMNLEDEI